MTRPTPRLGAPGRALPSSEEERPPVVRGAADADATPPAGNLCVECGEYRALRLSLWCARCERELLGTAQLYGPLPLFADGEP